MSARNIGYIRVSTADQNTERQLADLTLDKVFTDHASGKDTKRPALAEMLDYAREGDTITVHSMDRLARNLDDMKKIVNDLTSRGIKVHFQHEQLTFSGDDSCMSKLLLNIMASFAEFERSLIKERQREGIAAAKAKGVYKGRKKALSRTQADELVKRVAAGEKKAAIARDLNISRETLYQYLKAHDVK